MISCYADIRDNVFSFTPISEVDRSVVVITLQSSLPLTSLVKMLHTYLVTARSNGGIDILIRIDIDVGV